MFFLIIVPSQKQNIFIWSSSTQTCRIILLFFGFVSWLLFNFVSIELTTLWRVLLESPVFMAEDSVIAAVCRPQIGRAFISLRIDIQHIRPEMLRFKPCLFWSNSRACITKANQTLLLFSANLRGWVTTYSCKRGRCNW